MDSPEARSIGSPPWLFSRQGLALTALVMAIAATFRAADITFLTAALLLVGLSAQAWIRLAFVRLAYARRTSSARAFCGDRMQLESMLTNPRLLPLPWIEVWEQLPADLQPEGANERSYSDPRRVWVNRGLALWPYQRLRWRRQLFCARRGVFQLGQTCLRSGDPFGFLECEQRSDDGLELLVYPRVVPLRSLVLAPRHPSLDVVNPLSPVADPTRTATVRDYRPDDARRMIHWPTTARRGSLQVRVLEPASTLHVSLLLDIRGFTFGLRRVDLLELTLSALASIAVLLQSRGSPIAMLANSDPPLVVPPAASVAQLQEVLEGLARLQPRPGPPLIPWAFHDLPRGSTVVLATSDTAANVGDTITQLEDAGFATRLLLAASSDSLNGARKPGALVLTPGCDLAARLEGRG